MKKEIKEYEHKVSSKEYLVALIDCNRFVKLLNPENKSYMQLHDWLLRYNELSRNGEVKFPSIKEIAIDLKVESSKVAKDLRLIYDDIHELNERQPQLFCRNGQKLCFLSFKYLDQHVCFNLGLDVIPREGDTFHFYFAKPRNGGATFYVNNIVHDLDKGEQEVQIYLNSEYPIPYMQLLKEKAYLHGDITFMELVGELMPSIEQKLLKWNKNL